MSFKNYIKIAAVVATIATSAGWFHVLTRPTPPSRYEVAQSKIVLLIVPDGQGTGIVIKRRDSLGRERVFLWTAAHVMGKFTEAKVKINIRNEGKKVGETDFTASLIAKDEKIDVALLYVVGAPGNYFSGNEFGSIVPLHVGAPLYHVGNFFGDMLDGSFSKGVVSQIGAFPETGKLGFWPVLDQSTFTIEPGSSGGPVFNDKDDKVVGIAVGKAGEVSFYVPVRAVDSFATSKGLAWAVYGDTCPISIPLAPSIIPIPSDIELFKLGFTD
jgi:S1-C subfamily serine protease